LASGTYCFNGSATLNETLIDSAFHLDIMGSNQVTGVAVDAVYTDPTAERWEYGIYYELQGSLNGNDLM
jgi:hypothetical protein